MTPLIRNPPAAPLPDPDQDSQWYGETWVRYSLSQTLASTRYGHLFKAKTELALIINALGVRLFDTEEVDRTKPSSNVSVEFGEKLDAWYASLPACLMPAEIVLPFQLKLQ